MTQSEITTIQQLSARWSRVLGAATTSTLTTALELCLEDLGQLAEADVAFATLVDDDECVSDDFHWVRPGKNAIAPAVGSHLRETFASATELVRLGHVVAVHDLDEIELSPSERALAEANRLRAIVVVPVQIGSALIGVAGLLVFDEPRRWDRAIVEHVKLFSELLVRAVIRTQDRGALALADARARRISEFVPEGLLLVATDHTVNWASPSFVRMSGTAAKQLESKHVRALVHPEDRPELLTALHEAVDDSATVSARLRLTSGWRWCDLSLRLASEPGSGIPDEIVISVRDNHERQLGADELARATEIDPLTGALNRAGLSRAIDALDDHDAQIVIAYCDVDDFKLVNDRRGHDAGDDALRTVAHSLMSAVRPGDIVARVGGDEFAVVVVDPAPDDRATFGDRLLASVRGDDGVTRVTTLSIGIAGPGPSSGAAMLLQAADAAMYAAKRLGKDRLAIAD